MLQEVGGGADRLRDGLDVDASPRPRRGEVGRVELHGFGLVRCDQGVNVQHVPGLRRVHPTDPQVRAVGVTSELTSPLEKRAKDRRIARVACVRQRREVGPPRRFRQVPLCLFSERDNALLGGG